MHSHSLKAYQFDLPPELIAQYPIFPRDKCRLMIVDRKSGHIEETSFDVLRDFLKTGDSLILNDSKVFPARLYASKESGGRIEVLLVKELSQGKWSALIKSSSRLRKGAKFHFQNGRCCTLIDESFDGTRILEFPQETNVYQLMQEIGHIPLPPYIRKGKDEPSDFQNYQTVYANAIGSIAAPTAGLHFTKEMLDNLSAKGVQQLYVTLHVGLGTFKLVQSENITEHQMHEEEIFIPKETAEVMKSKTGRQLCIGTTACRCLEACATPEGEIIAGSFKTNLFIYPGYQFKVIDSLLTNFHLPGSSLLMLVSALAGYELMIEAYAKAIEKKFRFFSYGDAMLII